MRTLAIVEREQEYFRFTSKIVEADYVVTYEVGGVIQVLRTIRRYKNVKTIYLVGLRVVDIELIKAISRCTVNVIIRQHAFNENRARLTLGIVTSNFKKSINWIFVIIVLRILKVTVGLKYEKQRAVYSIFHYTEYYEKRFATIGLDYIAYLCDFPNPFTFGCVSNIKKAGRSVEAFYVDEPLSSTLGIPSRREIEALERFRIINNVTEIEVRLHPRSDRHKFDGVNFIKVVDDIPEYCEYLLGYRSNLLLGDFTYGAFFGLKEDTMEFVVSDLKKSTGQYIQEVKQKLGEINTI